MRQWLRHTVVKATADVRKVLAIHTQTCANDGSVADLTEFDPPPPSPIPRIVYRQDLSEWQCGTLGALREALNAPCLTNLGELEVWPTALGNLALCVRGPGAMTSETRWYAGYIDLHRGRVVLYEGNRDVLEALAENYPFSGDLARVVLSHDGTIAALEGTDYRGILPQREGAP